MPYVVVEDFKGGLNLNRMAVRAPAGTLRTLRDAHVTRGGEIEKRLAFVSWRTLPPGTVGLAAVGGVVYTFGTQAALPVPAPMVYQRLVPSGGATVTRIEDVKAFAGKLYVAALCSDGLVRHFYDGTQVTVFTGQASAERGRVLLTFNANVYAASGSVLHRSAINTPTDWNTGSTGAGFFDMSSQAQGSEELTGLAEYQSSMAVFSRRTTQIWDFDPDPAASTKRQTLRSTGCVAPRTVLAYAGTDTFFLADSGVRSLRARDVTDSPAAADVGTPVDDAVVAWLRTATADDLHAAHAVIEPTSGRYWLVLGNTVYVFSYFPAVRISAWSTYTLPGAASASVAVDQRVYTRIGDTVFLFGGESGDTYDSTAAEVELAYLDGRAVATWKQWTAIDIAAEGAWDVHASYSPATPTTEDLLARLTGSSFYDLDTPILGRSPIVKLRLTSVGAGAAKLGSLAVHYQRHRD